MRVSVIECSQPKGVTLKMKGRKLRRGECWQEALKQKGAKDRLHIQSRLEVKSKDAAVASFEAGTGSWGSRKLRLQDFHTSGT